MTSTLLGNPSDAKQSFIKKKKVDEPYEHLRS